MRPGEAGKPHGVRAPAHGPCSQEPAGAAQDTRRLRDGIGRPTHVRRILGPLEAWAPAPVWRTSNALGGYPARRAQPARLSTITATRHVRMELLCDTRARLHSASLRRAVTGRTAIAFSPASSTQSRCRRERVRRARRHPRHDVHVAQEGRQSAQDLSAPLAEPPTTTKRKSRRLVQSTRARPRSQRPAIAPTVTRRSSRAYTHDQGPSAVRRQS